MPVPAGGSLITVPAMNASGADSPGAGPGFRLCLCRAGFDAWLSPHGACQFQSYIA